MRASVRRRIDGISKQDLEGDLAPTKGPQGWHPARAAFRRLSTYLFARDSVERVWNHDERLKVVSFVRDHAGIASIEEIMTLTGRGGDEASSYAALLSRDYDGEPEVTEGGSLIYRFDGLAAEQGAESWLETLESLDPTGEESYLAAGLADRTGSAPLDLAGTLALVFGIFSGACAIGWTAGAPTVMGAAGQGAAGAPIPGGLRSLIGGAHVAHALPAVALVAGFLPAGIASAFLGLHLVAVRKRAIERRRMRERLLRKQVYFRVLSNPDTVNPTDIRIGWWGGAGPASRRLVIKILDELAASYDAEIEDRGDGYYLYHFPEIGRRSRDLQAVRRDRPTKLPDVCRSREVRKDAHPAEGAVKAPRGRSPFLGGWPASQRR